MIKVKKFYPLSKFNLVDTPTTTTTIYAW